MKDAEGLAALCLGLLVFGLLLAAPPLTAAQRLVTPTAYEHVCVNFVSTFTVWVMAPTGSVQNNVARTAISKAGLSDLALEAYAAIAKGGNAGNVLPYMYKQCLALKGQEVV